MNRRNLLSSLLVFLMPIFLVGQSVVGVVSGEGKKPLVGANVVIEGTDLGAVTSETGFYSIKVDSGTYTVTVTYIGYSSQSQEVAMSKDDVEIDFKLSIDALKCRHLRF